MRRKRKYYKHGVQRENVRWEDQEILQTVRKRLKEARHEILIHSTVYLRDRYMNDGRKRNKNSVNHVFHVYVQFHFPFCGPAAHYDLKLRTEHLPNM